MTTLSPHLHDAWAAVRFALGGAAPSSLSPAEVARRTWRLDAALLSVCCANAILFIGVEIAHANLAGTSPWQRSGATPEGASWCEARDADLTNLMIEPANARSDYAFVFVGSLMVALGVVDLLERRSLAKARGVPTIDRLAADEYEHGDGVNTTLTLPGVSISNGIANVMHGVGSWGNHACECTVGGRGDVAGMITVTVFPTLYVLLAVTPPLNRKSVGAGLLGLAQLGIWLVFWSAPEAATVAMFIILPLDILVVVGFAIYRRAGPVDIQAVLHYRYIFSPLGFFLIGWFAWNLDKNAIWCWPRSAIQGHAAWHLFTAAALMTIYLLFRSEGAPGARSMDDKSADGGLLGLEVAILGKDTEGTRAEDSDV